jgi:hypothetical protein
MLPKIEKYCLATTDKQIISVSCQTSMQLRALSLADSLLWGESYTVDCWTNIKPTMHTTSPEPKIDAFIDKYAPEIAAQLRDARKRLRSFFVQGYELVFDNYNALVFGFSPTMRSPESFISIAAYPKWITLFFLYGATLRDPKGLLEGSGKQIRSIRLTSPADINKPEVGALIIEAIRAHELALRAAPPLTTVIKTIAAKQRPRRPAVK